MATRRAFLHSGLVIPMLAAAGTVESESRNTASLREFSMPRRMSRAFLQHVLFEMNSPESVRFADAFRETNLDVYGLQDDVASFWYAENPYGSLKQRPETLYAIAGMTHPASAFCLEVAARDLRMRIALRIDHCNRALGSTSHVVSGPEKVVARVAGELPETASDWPRALAEIIQQLDTQDFAGVSVDCESITAGALEGSRGQLTTWVLAPVRSEWVPADS